MMKTKNCLGILLIGLSALGQATSSTKPSFRFLATGDLPYSQDQDKKYRQLLKQSEKEDFVFLMHVGDIKAKGVPCSNDEFHKIRDLFKSYPKPVVYTPGDNEWTDCHSVGSNPVERLRKLRELFFSDRTVLRLDQLNVENQNRESKFKRYIENYRFSRSGILFLVVHIVGSGNNYGTGPLATDEFLERNSANMAFLEESFADALIQDVPGIAIIIHANPDFEKGSRKGFKDFLAILRDFLSKYHKPVVCIHGDSHYYRIDKPFKDKSGKTYLNFTRMEVFGSPNVAGVAVLVDPAVPHVFSYQPYYLESQQ